jgi:hypothetical protein
MKVSQKTKIRSSIFKEIQIPKEMKSAYQRETCTSMFIAIAFEVAKIQFT